MFAKDWAFLYNLIKKTKDFRIVTVFTVCYQRIDVITWWKQEWLWATLIEYFSERQERSSPESSLPSPSTSSYPFTLSHPSPPSSSSPPSPLFVKLLINTLLICYYTTFLFYQAEVKWECLRWTRFTSLAGDRFHRNVSRWGK